MYRCDCLPNAALPVSVVANAVSNDNSSAGEDGICQGQLGRGECLWTSAEYQAPTYRISAAEDFGTDLLFMLVGP